MKTRLVKPNRTYERFIRYVGEKLLAEERAKKKGLIRPERRGVDHISIKKSPRGRKSMRRGF